MSQCIRCPDCGDLAELMGVFWAANREVYVCYGCHREIVREIIAPR